jgi:hypothetical protein
MGKTVSKRQPAIVMAVDQAANMLDLRGFAALTQHKTPVCSESSRSKDRAIGFRSRQRRFPPLCGRKPLT